MRQALGDRSGESNALRSLSFLQWHQGRLQDAVASNEAALAIDRERGDRRAMSHDLTNLAPVLLQLGDFTGALERLQLALDIEASQQDAFNRMTILFNIANVHNKTGEFRPGTRVLWQLLGSLLGTSPADQSNARALVYDQHLLETTPP
jgi:tetratricopeptide (TPR) repeat protein